ncbi:MAG: S8 family serine peptidase, partial [Nanoarchaeota archaeon]|nr:S8 family serine peptidase [Nanoarchaeota archaeon]
TGSPLEEPLNETFSDNETREQDETLEINQTIEANETTEVNQTIALNETLDSNESQNQTAPFQVGVNQTSNETTPKNSSLPLSDSSSLPLINETNEAIEINQTFEVTENESEQGTLQEKTPIVKPLIPEKQRTFSFEEACIDTCFLDGLENASLVVELSGNISLTLDSVQYLLPSITQLKDIPDQRVLLGNVLTIDLRDYFTSPQELYFETPLVTGMKVSIEDDYYLTITPFEDGNTSFFIYVTDGEKLLRSNVFAVTTYATIKESLFPQFFDQHNYTSLEQKKVEQLFEELPIPAQQELTSGKTSRVVITPSKDLPLVALESPDGQKKRYLVDLPTSVPIFVDQKTGNLLAVEAPLDDVLLILAETEATTLADDRKLGLFAVESLDITATAPVQDSGYTGTGSSICLVDTGVNTAVLNNIVDGYNFVDDTADYSSTLSHGTSVAHIISTFAPDAGIYVAKVIDDTGYGYSSDIIAGLEWCANQNVDIISLSIGEGFYGDYCDDQLVAQKVNELANTSITVVAASGNGGFEGISNPACASGALPVGASTKTDDLWFISNTNGNLLLLAPGENINTIDHDGNTLSQSGTSMSVPMVTGALADIFENRSLTPLEATDLLVHTGDIIEANGRNFSRLNTYNALIGNFTNNLTAGQTSNQSTSTGNFTPQACTSGNQCASPSEYCIGGTCTTMSASNDGVGCSSYYSSTSWTSYGTVASTGASWSCDTSSEVTAPYSPYYMIDCSLADYTGTTVTACDPSAGGNYAVGGLCAYSTGTVGSSTVNCDTTEAAYGSGSSYLRSDCYYAYTGGSSIVTCDNTITGGTFSANGLCALHTPTPTGVTHSDCATGTKWYDDDGTKYYISGYANPSSYDYDTDSTGDSCDTTAGSTYGPDGMWVSSGGSAETYCDTFGGVVRVDASNNNYYVANCDNSMDLCDTATASSNDPFGANGRCASGGCQTTGAICLNGVNYYSSMASCSNGNGCDSSRTGTGA